MHYQYDITDRLRADLLGGFFLNNNFYESSFGGSFNKDIRGFGDARATWGVCEGNPVHDDVRAIAAATGVDYGFDVVLNRDQRVIAAFGGDLLEMHAAARSAFTSKGCPRVGSLSHRRASLLGGHQ